MCEACAFCVCAVMPNLALNRTPGYASRSSKAPLAGRRLIVRRQYPRSAEEHFLDIDPGARNDDDSDRPVPLRRGSLGER